MGNTLSWLLALIQGGSACRGRSVHLCQSVSVEAAAAIATLEVDVRPDIQSDHGSGFISREFAETLAACGVGGGPNRGLFVADDCLTLIETNQ